MVSEVVIERSESEAKSASTEFVRSRNLRQEARPTYGASGAEVNPSLSNPGGLACARVSLLRLQQQRGNRYVQRLLAVAGQRQEGPEVAPEADPAIERGEGQALDSSTRYIARACYKGTWPHRLTLYR